jgi:hypothetical protein
MAERTKSTRVEFREETVCTYTDSKFMEMNPHCNKYQYASVVEEEEFNPITISQEHNDFVIRRNQAIPQALVPHASVNPVGTLSSIIPHVDATIFEDGVRFDDQGREITNPMLRANQSKLPNMSDAIENVINKRNYRNNLIDLNAGTTDGSVALQDLATAPAPTPTNRPLTQAELAQINDTSVDLDTNLAFITDLYEQRRINRQQMTEIQDLIRDRQDSLNTGGTSGERGTELSTMRTIDRARAARGSPGQGSSNDALPPAADPYPVTQPQVQPTDLNVSLANAGAPIAAAEFAIELPASLKNLKIPKLPDYSNKTLSRVDIVEQQRIYDIKMDFVMKSINSSYRLSANEKLMLTKQIELHQQEVLLRSRLGSIDFAEAGMFDDFAPFNSEFGGAQMERTNPVADSIKIELEQIQLKQKIYNEIRKAPEADRLSLINDMNENSLVHVDMFSQTSGKLIEMNNFKAATAEVMATMVDIVKVTPPVTQITPSQQTTLAKASRFQKIADTFKNVKAADLGKAFAHNVVGLGLSMLVAHYAGDAQAFKNITDIYQRGAAIGATVGVVGALPQVVMRFMMIAATKATIQAGETAAMATTRALVRGSITSITEIAMGGIIGAALVPLDMLFQDYLIKNGFTHAGAGALSGATMALTGTVASLAIGAAVESVAAGALTAGAALAPASLGLSVLVALGTVAFAAIVGAVMGDQADRQQREERNRINANRRKIIQNLPLFNYDVIATIQAMERKVYGRLATDEESDSDFGDYRTDMKPFIEMLQEKFQGMTFEHSNGPLPELNEREKNIQEYMRKDLLWTMKELADNDGNTSVGESIAALPDYGRLTKEEEDYLTKNTNGTWFTDSYLSAQIQYEELKYAQKKSAEAQPILYQHWNNTHSLQNDPELMRWAMRDPSFLPRFTQARMFDAQRIIMENFQNNGVLYDANSPDVIAMANIRDPYLGAEVVIAEDHTFKAMFETYTTNMTNSANEMNITVNQLLTLQNAPDNRRERMYLGFQYQTLRDNTLTRDEMDALAANDATNRDIISQGFYSRDDFILANTTPEDYNTWDPFSSQVYQAQLSGMTLTQYLDYMHLLGQGDRGDFNNLPEYSPQQIEIQRQQDRLAFERQIQLTGHSREFVYNETTHTFDAYDLDPTSSNYGNSIDGRARGRQLGADAYLPQGFVESENNYHTMVHGMNEENQKAYDEYNMSLLSELQLHSLEYDRQVAQYNDYQFIHGRSEFLFFDVEAEYNARRLTYNPISDDPYITKPDKNRKPDKIDPYDTRTGKPPRLTVDDNIEGLLDDGNKALAYEQIDKQTLETGRELSYNERQYIFKQAFNKQYYESAEEQRYWNERSSMMQRLNMANTGLRDNATDAERAENMHMDLATYYEWIGTLPRNDEIFLKPDEHKDELDEEVEEALLKLTAPGIESDDREEERMINADRSAARGDDGVFDGMLTGSYDTNIDTGGGGGYGGGGGGNEHDDYYNP